MPVETIKNGVKIINLMRLTYEALFACVNVAVLPTKLFIDTLLYVNCPVIPLIIGQCT